VHEPADRAAQDAGKVRIVVRQVVEGDRAQRRLVLRNGGGAGQRQHAEYGIVCPVYVVLIAEVQRVAGLPAEDGDPGADQVRVVAGAERHAGTDGDRRRLLDVANRGAARDHRGQIRADFDVVAVPALVRDLVGMPTEGERGTLGETGECARHG